MAFLGVAVGSALLYAFWVVWVPLLPDNIFTPLLDLGKITGYTWPAALLYLQLVLGAFVLYAVGYAQVIRGKAGVPIVFGAGGVVCFELVWAYPATAADVFGYIAQGRLLAVSHVNPFLVAPAAAPGVASILRYLAFPNEPSQYGPIWALLGGVIATLGGSGTSGGSSQALVSEVLLYKAVAGVAHVAGAAVIYRIAWRLTADELRARASAYLYLWNPLLLWEMPGNAHNDGLMMLLALIGAWCLVARADLFALPAVVLGGLVKVPVLLIWPLLFIAVWHRRRATAIESALLSVALAVVIYRPFWEGVQTLAALRRTDLFTTSFGSVLRLVLAPDIGLSEASATARAASFGAFFVVAGFGVYLAMRAETNSDQLRPAYFILLAGVLLATTWFQAWYVVWPLGLGAALGDPRRHLEVALLSLGGLLQYFVFIYLWMMGYFPPTDNLAVQSVAYLSIIGPLALGIVALEARRRGDRGSTVQLEHMKENDQRGNATRTAGAHSSAPPR